FAEGKDVEDTGYDLDEDQTADETGKVAGVWQFTKFPLLQAKRDAILSAFGKREDANLIKKTRALYWNPTKNVRVACTISKRYSKSPSTPYWYAYHPSWDNFLEGGTSAFLILGCMDRDAAYAIPREIFKSHLVDLNTTTEESGNTYWHIHLHESSNGEISIILPKKKSQLSLLPYS